MWPPEELREPTEYADTNLAIRMLSADTLRFETRALVGRYITEHSMLQAKHLAASSEPAEFVYEAWRNGTGEALDEALRKAVTTLVRLQLNS